MTYLDMSGNDLSGDLSPLRNLTSMASLSIYDNNLSGDLSGLRNLTSMASLDISRSNLSGDLSPLRDFTSMTRLDMSYNNLSGDLSPLRDLTSMTSLKIHDNNLSGNLSPLRKLTSIEFLWIGGNNLSGDLSPLRNLTSMISLDLSGNDLSGDLAALAPLTSLRFLELRHRGPGRGGLVGNLSFVQEMLGLRRLSIDNQQLSGGLGPLQNLPFLEYFSAGHNDLSGDLSSVPKKLSDLWLDGNKISGLGSGFNSSGVQILSLRSNRVKADDVVDVVKDLPLSVLYLDMSENEELRGDIGDLVSNVSSKTSIMDLFVKETNLTGRTEPSDVNFFRNMAWNTEDMGVLEMNKSGSRNFELESKRFSLSGVTFESTKELPREILSSDHVDGTYYRDPLQPVYNSSLSCKDSKEATSELDRKGGRNNTVRTTAGSKENRFVLELEQRDDRYLLMCSIFPPEFFLDWTQQTSFPYAQASRDDSRDTTFSVSRPVKQFISYNMTVQNSCGQSVCDSYVQSVSQERWDRMHPFWDSPFKEMHPNREGPFQDSDLRYDERKKFWQTPTPSLRGWPEDVVNSLCIVDVKKVFEECEEEGLRRFVDGARPVQIVATGAFMAPDQGRDISPDRQNWANATDYLTYTTYALIRKPPRKLKPVEIAAIAVGALAAFSAVVAALVFLLRRQKRQRLLSLMRTKEKLQVALLESTPPPRSIGKDICFVSTDIQSSTAMRVRSLEAYEEATQLHHNLLRQKLQEHGGVELLCEGDGFILGFDTAWAGTAFCCDLQQALQDVAWPAALQRLFRAIYTSPAPAAAAAGGRRGRGCLEAARLCGPMPTQGGLEAFNGLRVRCGVHWASEGTFVLEQSGPNVYVPSGPGYQRARLIGDVGHGGQVVLSKAAQTMLLCNLQAAKFPTVRDLGLHRLAGSAPGDAPERLYQVTPSVGEALKLRRFGPPRTVRELEPPLGSSRYASGGWSASEPVNVGDGGDGAGAAGEGASSEEIALVAVFVSERKSFEEAADRRRISAAAWDEVRQIVRDANRKFWGWHVEVGGSLAALERAGQRGPRDPEAARGGGGGGVNVEEVLALTADFAAQEAAGQAWLLAFEDAQDALRFCLSCCIELTYSPWEGYDAWRGGSSATTPDGAALWNGPPVGFTVHSVTRGGASSGDAGAGPELRCTRSLKGREETICGDVGAGLLEALVAARVLPSNARVVLTGPAWARLNEGLGRQSAHSGKAVVEHLGRALVPCLSRPLEAYQVLPVQLAARAGSFVSLRDAAPGRLTLLAPGAREAPRPTAHLTFMFTAWFAPSDRDLLELARRGPAGGGGGDRIGVGSGPLAVELQRVRRDCHSEML